MDREVESYYDIDKNRGRSLSNISPEGKRNI